ncbi:MAG TPA: hypothetical protein PKY31_17115 [Spirochaetota bacterium]|nr:hypothetical protein [Spirochaetota bacterium]
MKTPRSSLAIFTLVALLVAPSLASATTISVGPSVWYAWWQPAFENQYKGGNTASSSSQEFDINSTFLVGPAASILINPYWSLSALYMWTNMYKSSSGYDVPVIDERWHREMKIKKYDIDLTITYTLTPSLRIFGGLKGQGYEYNLTTRYYSYSMGIILDETSQEVTSRSLGPGVGMSYTMLLSQTTFISISASIIYMDTVMKDQILEEAYHTLGGNSMLSLFYRPTGSPVTISAGFRMQYLKHYFRPEDSKPEDTISKEDSSMHNQRDLFYGLMFTAVYSFEI